MLLYSMLVRPRGSKMLTTNLSPQRILEALPKSKSSAVTPERLAQSLGLTESQAETLERFLAEFTRAGLAAKRRALLTQTSVPGC